MKHVIHISDTFSFFSSKCTFEASRDKLVIIVNHHSLLEEPCITLNDPDDFNE